MTQKFFLNKWGLLCNIHSYDIQTLLKKFQLNFALLMLGDDVLLLVVKLFYLDEKRYQEPNPKLNADNCEQF